MQGINSSNGINTNDTLNSSTSTELSTFQLGNLISISLLFLVIGLIFIIFRLFLGYMLEIGARQFFIQAAQGNTNMRYLGAYFKKQSYLDIFKTMLYRDVIVFLWSLLLVIPGIVKSYAYRMVPFILADNPNVGYKRALEISNAMTKGHKMNIFIFDLSFLGWYILGLIPFGLGTFFVNPYYDATDAELYRALRQEAINQGVCTYAELNMTAPVEA